MKNITPTINWSKGNGLIPAVIQDAQNGTVLMLGFMNQEALKKTLRTKKVWFYSRTKKRLWQKGETSGNILQVKSICVDCDTDTLLIQALPTGPVCHTGSQTCFDQPAGSKDSLAELFQTLIERKKNMPAKSYTASLFKKGLDRICVKIAEESGEVIKAATKESKQRLVLESVDLLYHLFVLLVQQKISYSQLLKEVARRRK